MIETLGIVLQGELVLLGQKKKGKIGVGKFAGPGGRLEPGENLLECLVRETREELDVELDPAALELAAILDIYIGRDIDRCVYVYRAKILFGELKETADMIPAWYPIDDLPYDNMFDADRHWFLKAARGEKFFANVYYEERAKGFLAITFSPFPD